MHSLFHVELRLVFHAVNGSSLSFSVYSLLTRNSVITEIPRDALSYVGICGNIKLYFYLKSSY